MSGFGELPPLDGELSCDSTARAAAGGDIGRIVHRTPSVVLRPGSVDDIVKVVQFARSRGLKLAARGRGHTTFGQSQVEAGVLIDMTSLATIHPVAGDRVTVDAGTRWRTLLPLTLEHGLRPPVLTDYVDLTVGGTLSVGGISGDSYSDGAQVDNVLELQVVTGEGNLETCSPLRKPDLFDAALAGQGQCAIIVRATVRLVPAKAAVRVFDLFYPDLQAMIRAARRLIADGRFDFVVGFVTPSPAGGWAYLIEAACYYTPPVEPDRAALLAGLGHIPGSEQIRDEPYLDWAYRVDAQVAELEASGVWGHAHPWLDVFVPGSAVERYVSDVLSALEPTDLYPGDVILLYGLNRDRLRQPMLRVPDEDVVFLFDVLRSVPRDAEALAAVVAGNRAHFERNRALGGTHYPIAAVPLSRQDWQRHFGAFWDQLVTTKQRYDPDHILNPGPGIWA